MSDHQPRYTELAQHLASKGRNGDSILVHMTPNEVGGLQALAMAKGGSLTINPQTGLPEASFLENVLPMVLGAALNLIPGVGTLASAAMVGGGYGLAKGDLMAGLSAGLGAFGGASLGSAMGLGGAAGGLSSGAADAATSALSATTPGAATAANPLTIPAGPPLTAPPAAPLPPMNIPTMPGAGPIVPPIDLPAGPALGSAYPTTAPISAAGVPAQIQPGIMEKFNGFYDKFKGAANAPNADGSMNTANTLRSGAATAGVLMPLMSAMEPTYKSPEEQDDGFNYDGPYKAVNRPAQFRNGSTSAPQGAMTGAGVKDTSEFQYFNPVNPFPAYTKATSNTGAGANGALTMEQINQLYGPHGAINFASGGPVLNHGSFVVDARTVAELGNGSSQAGQDILARLGGVPIKGKGDGVSDSIPASIGGVSRAKVARDEVKFSPEAVKRIGGGDMKRGTQKLYALMEQAKKARASAQPGQDTNLRGLMGIR